MFDEWEAPIALGIILGVPLCMLIAQLFHRRP